jgi:hypothetical protein
MAKSSQVGRIKVKALKNEISFFRTLQNAGSFSNALESMSSKSGKTPKSFDLEQFQRQGNNQQDLNKLNTAWRKKRLKELNPEFIEWLVGFTEGIGSFFIEKGKSCFAIHLHFSDLPTLIEIKTQLNIGTIFIHKKSVEFKVSDPKEIGFLIEIFNGKFFLKTRQVQFNGWYKNYISKTQDVIELISYTFKPSLNDGWLAGLFDVAGHVKLNVFTRSPDKSFFVTQCLTIKLKDVETEFKYLSMIINSKFFVNRGYSSVVVSNSDLEPMVKYFTRYKLYTIKARSMEKWLTVNNSYIINSFGSEANIVGYTLAKKNAAFIKFNTKLHNVRHYSQLSEVSSSKLLDFYEWFRGLVDGEGSFDFRRKEGTKNFEFNFRILLHIDDLALLLFIQSKLGVGAVKTSLDGKTALFKVIRIKDIQVIIDIFSSNPLNTTKNLNFQDFKKAYELYINADQKSIELINQIDNIKLGMNKSRTEFKINNEFKITPYWVLGFVEGEGSFFISKGKGFNYKLGFSLSQSKIDKALMEEIRKFLLNLPAKNNANYNYDGKVVNLSMIQSRSNSKEAVLISSYNTAFFKNVLIPFFDSMIWQSKKKLDYEDWKIVLKLRELGQNYTELGIETIELIASQMNIKRLSTNPAHHSIVKREVLYGKIDKLLNSPSNLERREDGRIFIISENRFFNEGAKLVQLLDNEGNILNTFTSRADCGKFLDVSNTTVANWLAKDNHRFMYKGKLVYLQIVPYL